MAEPSGSANPWWVVLAAGVPSVASGLWVLWRWWIDRGDTRATALLTHEQGLIRELEQQRAALNKEHQDLFDRIRAELGRTEARLAEVERHRDRGWDLARWWNHRAHELRQAGVHAQAAAQTLALAQSPPAAAFVWPDMTLPGFEDPA